MTFARLRAADWVVLVAALGLILVTAADWYSTQSGAEARTVEDSAERLDVRERAALIAENEERNAWQPVGVIAFAAALSLRQEESAGAADLQSRR